MRDPKRIEDILNLLNELWKLDEDLRFNQLVYNLQYEYSSKNNKIGRVIEKSSDGYERIGFDMFNLEDDLFYEFLREKISGGTGQST